MDQLTKPEVAQCREHAHYRGKQNHLDIVELIAAKPEVRLDRINLGSRHPDTQRRSSDLEETLDDFQRLIELIVMHPMPGLLDRHDFGVLEHLGAAVLLPVAGP